MSELIEKLQLWWQDTGLVHHLLPTLALLLVGIILVRIVITIVNRMLKKSKLEKAAHGLIRSVIRIVLYLLLGLICASALGIDVTGIVALASVVTLALSLALQNSLTNLIGGFTLLYTKPFVSDDYVEIAGQSGTVQEIGLTYTKLVTPDNKIVSIPNSAVVAAEIVNYTVAGTRRLDINLQVSYSVSAEQVLQIMEKAAKQNAVLAEPAPVIAMKEYNEQSITCGMMLWCKSSDYWDLKFAVNRELNSLAKDAGITFYDPKLRVHLEQ